MEVTRTTVAILAAACVTAGAAGGYLATRDSEPTTVAAAPDSAEVVALDQGVEATEASVLEAPDPPAPAPAPAPAPVVTARTSPRAATVEPRSTPPPPPRTEPHAAIAAPVATPTPAVVPTEVLTIAPAVIEPSRPAPEPEPVRPVEPPRPEYLELVLASDAVIGLQVETAVSSETAKIEDPVTARVTRDVKVGGQVAIPAGSKARGEVTLVERGGKLRDKAKLGVRFTSIVLADGTQVPITTETIYREGETPTRESAAKIGGGAIGGAIIGGILGGAKGVAIGSAIGGGAGSAAVMAGGRNPATLSPGSPVTIRLEQPATVTVEK